jgi:pimeloyl-ACP methyl ester carboxylesterase
MATLTEFRHDGLTFTVRDGGDGGDGEPVVLLHGFPQTSTCWTAVEPALHAGGLRTLAPDQRGYSPAARPPGRRSYQVGALAADILALLDAAGLESAHIVGHDWGGAVAWALAGLHPERVRSLTVLSTPHSRALAKSLTSSTQALKSWYMFFFQLPLIPELALSATLGANLARTGLPADQVRRDVTAMRQLGAATGALNWYRALPFSLRKPAPRSAVPTTFIWGRDDPFLGRAAAELTGDFVSGPYRFVELPAGHWLAETHPDEVAALILDRIRTAI